MKGRKEGGKEEQGEREEGKEGGGREERKAGRRRSGQHLAARPFSLYIGCALGSVQCYRSWFRPSCLGSGNNSESSSSFTQPQPQSHVSPSILSLPLTCSLGSSVRMRMKLWPLPGDLLDTVCHCPSFLPLLSRLAFPTSSRKWWARPHLYPSVQMEIQTDTLPGPRASVLGQRGKCQGIGCHPYPRAAPTGRSPAASQAPVPTWWPNQDTLPLLLFKFFI